MQNRSLPWLTTVTLLVAALVTVVVIVSGLNAQPGTSAIPVQPTVVSAEITADATAAANFEATAAVEPTTVPAEITLESTAEAAVTETILPAVATNNALATLGANVIGQATEPPTAEATQEILPAVATNNALATTAANLLEQPTLAAGSPGALAAVAAAAERAVMLPPDSPVFDAAVQNLLSPMPSFEAETTPEAEATGSASVEGASLVSAQPEAVLFAAQTSAQIDATALYHDSRADLYRTPGGAAPFDTTVTLRLQAEAGDLDSATARVWSTRDEAQTLLPMTVVATTPDGYDLWEAALDVGDRPTNLWYRFIVTRGNQTLYYEDDTRDAPGAPYRAANEGGAGMSLAESLDNSFQITVYDPDYYTPDWMRNAVVYQIFPDRFRNGDTANDPADGEEVFYDALPLIFHETWNEPPVNGREVTAPDGQGYYNSDFYGGDLAGITEELDYLQDLGVTAIYLNPIFLARSNHRYDTVDFLEIDPYLGTLEDFQTLVSEADTRGMKIILDGVFNHMSSDSPAFDRFDRFSGSGGACENVESPFRAWFFFVPPRANQPAPCAGDPDPLYYTSWAGFDTIPRINNTIIDTRRYFFLDEDSVAKTWGRENIGGWRLDVAPDIDNGRDPNNIYWETFRSVVRQLNPETVIVGEEWGDASEWFQGDEWDSTMNYRLRAGILGFVRDSDYTDNDANGDRIIYALSPSQLDSTIRSIEEDYPRAAYHALMNVLSSHDVSRLLFVVGDDVERQKLAALTQFTLPGAPTIYYGDEISIDAPSIPDSGGNLQDDPFNRAPYPWPDTEGDTYPAPNDDTLAFYQQLGALRRDNPALRTGEMVTLVTDDQAGIYGYLRLDKDAGNVALVVLNNSDTERETLVDYSGYLPTGLTLQPAFGGEPINTDNLSAQLTIPASSGNVWTVTEQGAFAVPEAPASLDARSSSGEVSLKWDAVDGAGGYLVYRSPVAVGGFQPLFGRPIAETSFVDDTVQNGFVYHYAVAPVTDTSLIGPMSASVNAAPSYSISSTAYIGDSAQNRSIELFSGVTVPVQAVVTIDGVTGGATPAPGIRAEAALIPADGSTADADWTPMVYTGAQDGADVYEVILVPQQVGEYQVVARFSANAGQDWHEVTLEGGAFPALTITASSDTTPPDAPAEVRIVRATLSGVRLEWDAVTHDGLFLYRVYRASGENEAELIAEVSGTTFYTDSAVVEGSTYTYFVSAVDGALNESERTASEPVTVERLVVPVTFTAEVPAGTPPTVYIAGNFGSGDYPQWDPAGIEMEQVDDTHWSVTLNIKEGTAIEYKYVRGDWAAVEKDADCQEIANRRLTVKPDENGEQSVQDTVEKWRDLDACG